MIERSTILHHSNDAGLSEIASPHQSTDTSDGVSRTNVAKLIPSFVDPRISFLLLLRRFDLISNGLNLDLRQRTREGIIEGERIRIVDISPFWLLRQNLEFRTGERLERSSKF